MLVTHGGQGPSASFPWNLPLKCHVSKAAANYNVYNAINLKKTQQ